MYVPVVSTVLASEGGDGIGRGGGGGHVPGGPRLKAGLFFFGVLNTIIINTIIIRNISPP